MIKSICPAHGTLEPEPKRAAMDARDWDHHGSATFMRRGGERRNWVKLSTVILGGAF